MVGAGRWLPVRLGLFTALLIGTEALAAILVSQDAGWYCLVCLFSFFDQEKFWDQLH